MSEELQQQSENSPVQESQKIANPLELLKSGSDKLAKYGGFDLIESSIDGAQNLNPERKARRNIFLSESQKKEEREQLLRTLQVWADALSANGEISDIIDHAEKKSEECQRVVEKNVSKAIEETRELERSYRNVAFFF